MVWYVSGEESAKLPVGQYSLSAALDSRDKGAPDSWKGVVESPPVTITIVEAPANPTPEQEREQALVAVLVDLWRGDNEGALAAAEALEPFYRQNPDPQEPPVGLMRTLDSRVDPELQALSEPGPAAP